MRENFNSISDQKKDNPADILASEPSFEEHMQKDFRTQTETGTMSDSSLEENSNARLYGGKNQGGDGINGKNPYRSNTGANVDSIGNKMQSLGGDYASRLAYMERQQKQNTIEKAVQEGDF